MAVEFLHNIGYVSYRLVRTEESSRTTDEREKEAWQAKGNGVRLTDEKECEMDYLQLKRMTEDRTEWQ